MLCIVVFHGRSPIVNLQKVPLDNIYKDLSRARFSAEPVCGTHLGGGLFYLLQIGSAAPI